MYLRGKQLYAAKNYAAAGDEFAAAYAIDPDSKFLLFNVALARRMAGDCREALTAYRTFVAARPPAEQASNAQIGIDRCEAALAKSSTGPGEPTTAVADKPPVADKPSVTDKPRDADKPPVAGKVAPNSAAVETPRHVPWYSDGVGDVLLATGSAAIVAGVVLQLSARSAARATYHPASLADFEANRDWAGTSETLSWIAGGAGLALITAGVLHIRHHQRTVAIAPTGSGVAITLGGAF